MNGITVFVLICLIKGRYKEVERRSSGGIVLNSVKFSYIFQSSLIVEAFISDFLDTLPLPVYSSEVHFMVCIPNNCPGHATLCQPLPSLIPGLTDLFIPSPLSLSSANL